VGFQFCTELGVCRYLMLPTSQYQFQVRAMNQLRLASTHSPVELGRSAPIRGMECWEVVTLNSVYWFTQFRVDFNRTAKQLLKRPRGPDSLLVRDSPKEKARCLPS